MHLLTLPVVAGGSARSTPIPIPRSGFSEIYDQLSPDSKWIAYTSDESGQREVYVRPFPSGEGQWKVSIDGGEAARWRGDGKEIFFLARDYKIMTVDMKAAAPAFEAGKPHVLFDAHLAQTTTDYEYDVTSDGNGSCSMQSQEAPLRRLSAASVLVLPLRIPRIEAPVHEFDPASGV